MKSTSYQEYLINSLKDPIEAAGYLNASLEGGNNVVKAHGGVADLAKKTHKSRTSLYKVFAKKGNPYLKNTNEILSAMGLHLAVIPV